MKEIILPLLKTKYELSNYLDSLNLNKETEYSFIINEEYDFDIGYELKQYLKYSSLIYKGNRYDNALYFASKDNPYHILVSVDENAKTLHVHPNAKCIASHAAYNHYYLEDLLIESNECTIGSSAFYGIKTFKNVTFKNSEHIKIQYDAFKHCKIKELNFDMNGEYVFEENSFASLKECITAIPKRSIPKKDCFEGADMKLVFFPKEIKDIHLYSFSKYSMMYFEGDSKNVLFKEARKEEVTEYACD